MSQHLKPTTVPITSAELGPSDWVRRVRSAAERDGQALRRNGVTIEAKCLHTNQWKRIMLPSNGCEFVSEREAEAALKLLNGDR